MEAALGKLDLDAKTRLLSGQDMWTLPALPEIGLDSLVMSDGPIGVRGVRGTADDPSVALPSRPPADTQGVGRGGRGEKEVGKKGQVHLLRTYK